MLQYKILSNECATKNYYLIIISSIIIIKIINLLSLMKLSFSQPIILVPHKIKIKKKKASNALLLNNNGCDF